MRIGRRNKKYTGESCSYASLSTTPTLFNLGSNRGRRGGRPATGRLNSGNAHEDDVRVILSEKHWKLIYTYIYIYIYNLSQGKDENFGIM
jgi:hypothetical protein